MPRQGEGPIPARIMLVGESWSYDDERARAPFQGESGKELNRMLHEAGIMRSECYCTNLVNARAPQGNLLHSIALAKKDQSRVVGELGGAYLRDKIVSRQIIDGHARLLREIEVVDPNVIVAMGNSAMWALCGNWSADKWRGSMLKTSTGRKLIPTFAPWRVITQWADRAILVHDLRRVKKECETRNYAQQPPLHLTVRPSFNLAISTLDALLGRLAAGEVLWVDFDLETRAGHIACAGLSWSSTDALCIPLMDRDNPGGYWPEDMETEVVWRLHRVLTHPNVKVRGQNLLYDAQYTWKWWHFIPRVCQDTMIAQHSAFVALPKSLDFLASMYCQNYRQWKPEKSSWKG
jgi:uracil-DNA glycosylase